MMQNEFQPKENLATQTTLATETEAKTRAANLQTFASRTVRRLKTRKRCYKAGKGAVAFSGLVAALLFGGFGSYGDAIFYLVLLPLTLLVLFGAYHGLTQQAIRADVEALAQRAGVQAVGTLFEMLRYTVEPQIADAIYRVLTRLLPQMKASDAPLLTPVARRTIHAWLHVFSVETGMKSHLNALRVAALKALEQVGDSRDIPLVEQLAKIRPWTQGQAEIKQAAVDCLPMLRANCGDVEAPRTLLRASHAQDACPETLLRPASNVDTAAQDLLRGAEKP